MKKGFTLIELLAVIAILAILIVIAVPGILKIFNQSKENVFLTESKEIYNQAEKDYARDAMMGTPNGIYSSINGEKSLNLNTNYDYIVGFNDGKITDFVVTDGTNTINIKDETEVKIEEINKENKEETPITNIEETYDLNSIHYFTDNGSFRYYSKASGNKIMILFKSDSDLKYKSGWTASSSENAIYRLPAGEYKDYTHVSLVDMTGKTPKEAIKLWILSNIEEVAVGTNTTLAYDWNTNGQTGGRLADAQATYDFTSNEYNDPDWHWSPTDINFLKADMCKCETSVGKVNQDDVDAFLYVYAQFRITEEEYTYCNGSSTNNPADLESKWEER